jgi:hypothetical protein
MQLWMLKVMLAEGVTVVRNAEDNDVSVFSGGNRKSQKTNWN